MNGDRVDIIPGVRTGDDRFVILLVDATIHYRRGVLVDLDAGCTLELPQPQAQRMVDAGLARWPGKAPSPAVCA